MLRSVVFAAVMAPALAFADPTPAPAAPDPAIATVDAFDSALLSTMKKDSADALGAAIDAHFHVGAMAAFIVGPGWPQLSAADRAAVTAALRRYLIARFADEFDTFNGEKFQVDKAVMTRGPDKLVKTQVQSPNDKPAKIDYRLRAYGGAWRIIDVYYNGVSSLTTQRADFAATLKTGGATALVARIDQATKALKG